MIGPLAVAAVAADNARPAAAVNGESVRAEAVLAEIGRMFHPNNGEVRPYSVAVDGEPTVGPPDNNWPTE